MRSFDRTKKLKPLAGLVRPHMKYVPEEPEPIVVPKMSLAEMVAAGNHSYVNDHINEENFPANWAHFTTEGTKVFHFSRSVSTERAIALMEAEGYDPARIETLLAYGKENLEEQRKHPIVALGSSCVSRDGNACSPCLYRFGVERGLYLRDRGYGWSGVDRFLAVRKSST